MAVWASLVRRRSRFFVVNEALHTLQIEDLSVVCAGPRSCSTRAAGEVYCFTQPATLQEVFFHVCQER